MAKCKDGWRAICGWDVYIEDGFVVRGVSSGPDVVPVYPYRKDRHGGWNSCSGLTVAAFRAGVKRGTVRLM